MRQPDKCSIPVLLDGEDGSHCPRVRKVPVGSLSPPGLLLLRQLNLLDVDFYRKHDFHGFQDYRRNLTRTHACLDIPVGALAYLATYPPTCDPPANLTCLPTYLPRCTCLLSYVHLCPVFGAIRTARFRGYEGIADLSCGGIRPNKGALSRPGRLCCPIG